MGMDGSILCGQWRFVQCGLGDNNSVERIACPRLPFRMFDNFGKGVAAEFKPNGAGERLNNLGSRYFGPADFVKILEFKADNGRDVDVAFLNCLANLGRQEVLAAGVQPCDHVRVQIYYGRHSFDQSTWTKDSGSTAR